MFFTNLMIRTDNRTLKKRPDILNRVGMNVTTYPFLGTMIDGLMYGIFVTNAIVSGEIIGVNRFGVRFGMRVNKLW